LCNAKCALPLATPDRLDITRYIVGIERRSGEGYSAPITELLLAGDEDRERSSEVRVDRRPKRRARLDRS